MSPVTLVPERLISVNSVSELRFLIFPVIPIKPVKSISVNFGSEFRMEMSKLRESIYEPTLNFTTQWSSSNLM